MQTPAPSLPNIQPPAGAGMPQQNGQASQQPSGRAGQNYNPQLLQQIEQHLNTLPDEQKGFLVKYMTPELAVILGIVIGNEAYDYFSKFADPKKELVVQERKQQQKSAPQPQPKSAHAVQSVQSVPNPQPQASAQPAKSIMGV